VGAKDAEDADAMADALDAVEASYLGLAAELAEAERYCDARVLVSQVALWRPDSVSASAASRYARACGFQEEQKLLAQMQGRVIYSTQRDGQYQIYEVQPGPTPSARLLVNDGAQPSVRPDGQVIAFHNTRTDWAGLAGLGMYNGDPNSRTERYGEHSEDGKHSPSAWSPTGDRLVFAGTRNGERIYLFGTSGSASPVDLGYGKDPAWHPFEEWVVYNGINEEGNAGLLKMRPAGDGRAFLTDNGNDLRPSWSPDGRFIVFMSSGRHDNWEVYRYELNSGALLRLTNHPAQDGLPSVSPDGQFVAFVSDRDGYWRLWYVPIDGGEAKPLAPLEGALVNWLEHSIQWVR
jgi:Tol biopolymer transport system component